MNTTTNSDLLERRNAAVVRGIGHTTPISVSHARNAELWDVEGRRYVDFAGGIGVLNTGHCHPEVMAAVRAQLERFTHTCFQVAMYEPYIELAERLNAIAPVPGPLKCALFTTGAEATENAIKVARAATRRYGVIAFTGGFHGRTVLASAMTGKVMPYKNEFGLALPGVWHVPFPTANNGVSAQDALRHLDFIFKADCAPSGIAAIIIEPVQGEGGFHQAPHDLMRGLRRVCDEHGIVLIADEVQSGFGRTGKMFAMEHYDVSPDLICMAKSLAGGFPLSAIVGKASIMDAAGPGGLGGTYAGNPLACAASLAVLDVFRKESLLERANAAGERFRRWLHEARSHENLLPIADIRGPGAMVAFDIVTDAQTREPDPSATKRAIQRAYENGLLLLSCGTHANTIRILAPLTAEDSTLDEGLSILHTALSV